MSDPTLLSAGELARALALGQLSALEATRAHLARIERWNGRLAAFVRLNPRAEDEARLADRRREQGRAGPLNGVPVALKDNLDTAGLETSCGSRILRGFVPARDATAVVRLREAGAVVLGKTNLDEFAMGSSTESSVHGPTRNPWDPERVPGGSSGGSAVAVAARLAPLALGSDTGGSVRQPAAFCGVVGFKPTYGRVSRLGLVAFGSSLDQIGTLTRSVADAALAAELIAGPDRGDATSLPDPVGDWVAACSAGVDGLRVGLPREYLAAGLDPEIASAVQAAADALSRAGARVEEVSLPHTPYAIPVYYLLATAEASSNLARYDGIRYGQPEAGSASLIESYRRTRGRGFGTEVCRRIVLGTYALSAGYHARFYGRAQRARARIRGDFERVFSAGVALLLTPAAPTPPFRIGEKTDDPLAMYLSDVHTVTANLAGIPGLALPVGTCRDGSLPLGVQLLAPRLGEEVLFRAASVLEQAFPPCPPAWLAAAERTAA